jgi:hypothetical protein
MRAVVYSVDSLNCEMVRDGSRQILLVSVVGKTTTGGWTDPLLIPWIHVAPAADGLLNANLTAKSPKGPSTDALTEVRIEKVPLAVPHWVKGIRVHASSNDMKRGAQGSGANPADYRIAGGDPNPWPWYTGKD